MRWGDGVFVGIQVIDDGFGVVSGGERRSQIQDDFGVDLVRFIYGLDVGSEEERGQEDLRGLF